MSGGIAIHSTHEAADKLGGIGTVLQGLLPEPAYQEAFPQSLLVGVYPFPLEESVVDDPVVREAKGWTVLFDSGRQKPRGKLNTALADLAEEYGVRLVYGRRAVVRDLPVPVLIASPQGLSRSHLDAFRHYLWERTTWDLTGFDDFPAMTDRVDRRLERLLTGKPAPDEPERVVVDHRGRPFPGGAAWADGRAVFPAIASLDSFAGNGRSNKYLLELQYHTFIAPVLWAAAKAVLTDWAPRRGGGYNPDKVTFFAHDWIGVPLYWAMLVAGDRVRQSVYFAHEARIFRLLAEGALQDRAALLRAVCNPDGHDASLYPYLAEAMERGWDLATMFPGTGGFVDVFHHSINREAARFDKIVAVGPLVRDELTVALRPLKPKVALCPNGIPASQVTADQAWAAHERLADVVERQFAFRPDVIFTGVMRCELSKAPWRNVGLFRRFAERFPERRAAFFWLSAPKPRPTRAQVQRWAQSWRWPLDHRGGEGGDLRPEEEGLWAAIDQVNRAHEGRAAMLYVNQFGWGPDVLGALDPGASSFLDVRGGSDLEVGLSIYEPFGIAPLEPFCAGTLCILSDACGCARHLEALGIANRVVIGRFTDHELQPPVVNAAALRSIEEQVYDRILDQVAERFDLSGPLDPEAWRRARAKRITAARKVIGQLSWQHALEAYLLPALAEEPPAPPKPARTRTRKPTA